MTNNMQIPVFKVGNKLCGKLIIGPEDAYFGSIGPLPIPIVLFDRSASLGSMGKKLENTILPKVFLDLGYPPSKKIKFLLFNTETSIEDIPLSDLKSSNNLVPEGGTYLTGAMEELEKFLKSKKSKDFLILFFTDGEFFEEDPTYYLKSLENISHIIKENKLKVISKSCRYIENEASKGKEIENNVLAEFNKLSYIEDKEIIELIMDKPEETLISTILNSSPLQKTKCIFQLTEYKDLIDLVASMPPDILRLDIQNCSKMQKPKYICDFNFTRDYCVSTSISHLEKFINVFQGENYLWFKDGLKSVSLFANGRYLRAYDLVEKELKYRDEAEDFLFTFVKNHLDEIKELKKLDPKESQDDLRWLIERNEKLLQSLENFPVRKTEATEEGPLEQARLNSRLMHIRNKQNKTVAFLVHRMKELEASDIVSQLNETQNAELLRGVDCSETGKGLARRAVKNGLSFEGVIKEEIRNISKNLKAFNEENSLEGEAQSFVTLESTLDGLESLKELVDEGLLEDCSLADILKLTNLVGVACDAPFGDYPDPKKYFVKELYPETYVCVSDLATVFEYGMKSNYNESSSCQSQENRDAFFLPTNTLSPPGRQDMKIINVVPVFKSKELLLFYRKHAPTLLEFITGVGMRRVFGIIPKTFISTLIAGFGASVRQVSKNQTEAYSSIFTSLLENLQQLDCPIYKSHYLSRTRFEFIISAACPFDKTHFLIHYNKSILKKRLDIETPETKSEEEKEYRYHYFIEKLSFEETEQNLAYIYRSMLAEEYYLSVKRMIKSKFKIKDSTKKKVEDWVSYLQGTDLRDEEALIGESVDEIYDNLLTQLIGETIEKRIPAFNGLFEKEDPSPKFDLSFNDWASRNSHLKEVTKRFDHIVLLREYLKNNFSATLSEEYLRKAFGIDYSIRTFKFFNLFTALWNRARKDRVDEKEEKVLLPDFETEEVGNKYISDIIEKECQKAYNKLCKERELKRNEIKSEELNSLLTEATDVGAFCKLLKDGIFDAAGRSYKIVKSSDPNLIRWVKESVKDEGLKGDRSLLIEKLRVVLMGEHNGEEVYNGNRVARNLYRDIIRAVKKIEQEKGDELEKLVIEKGHRYRGKTNRHGHSNRKPSYSSMGFNNIFEFRAGVSEEQWSKYSRIHRKCCNVSLVLKMEEEKKRAKKSE